MSNEPGDLAEEQSVLQVRRRMSIGRSRLTVVLFAIAALLVLALAIAWSWRERIADNLISSELVKRGIPASYRIDSIGPREQVLSNLVIGDPKQPDFTAERVIVSVRPRFGVPDVGTVRLVRPRLYGTVLNGRLSFGSLDPLIFTDSTERFRLPDIDLAIEDGRGLIESDYGAAGIKIAGSGNLRGGFAGQLAAISNDARIGGCAAGRVSIFGRISVFGEKPAYEGPIRLTGLSCPLLDLRLADAAISAKIVGDTGLDGFGGNASLKSGVLRIPAYGMDSLAGWARFAWRNDRLNLRYDLTGKTIETPQLRVPGTRLAGRLRTFDGFSRIDLESEVTGRVEALGEPYQRALAEVARGGEGDLISVLAGKAGNALRHEARGATFTATLTARRTEQGDSLVVPGAVLRGKSGEPLVSLSRLQFRMDQEDLQLLSGSFLTGGPDLPRISGTARRANGSAFSANLAMAEYVAGDARLAVPDIAIAQRGNGLGFSGELRMSGAIPGGRADNLVVPVSGDWSNNSGLTVWQACTRASFDGLTLSGLNFSKQAISLCPPRGGAIVRLGATGLKIAAGVPALDLAGRLGGSPIRIASGAVGLALPGNLAARDINVTLGPASSVSTFRVSRLLAKLDGNVAGGFNGAEVKLDAVPLDLSDMSGRLLYTNGVLTLSEGNLRVSDREQIDRFEPLVARDATLRLHDNAIAAEAVLREPASDRQVLRVDIRHDLAKGRGDAGLFVEDLLFDKQVQPDTLTPLALGVIANAKGTVRGSGQIEWDDAGIASTGRFSTEALDFAAAFGPVSGASGVIEFTDFLNLVTAPDQTLRVVAINPGIEVNDGVLRYALEPGNILAVKEGRWPFMDGSLRLRPVDIELGEDHAVRYVLDIDGIDAARFVQRLELGNLAATGKFDGQLPLIFDKDGGRIESGRLTSREPGGNVSYVGELTYKDLSPMANFAFDALRSIDFRHMAIQLEGPLDGEVVTRVTFDGISQGEEASSNFVTRRIAKLPIRFRLNIRAPFIQLMTSMRSLYDPEYVLDPRVLGITGKAAELTRPKSNVQPLESEIAP